MWNYSSRVDKSIKDGKQVKVHGNLKVFAKSGSYNFDCSSIELLGIGNLYQEYNDLKEKFTKAGYFDDSKKKKLPSTINSLGIITAQDGAALQDFLYVIKKNNFTGKIYIKNCLVQGTNCPNSVSEAIQELDGLNLDLIIVARGGGSFEDLFGFSSEQVVESLYSAKTCTMSAIGHEVDFMLSDYVADIRAPTPSIAGELVSCKRSDILNEEEICNLKEIIKSELKNKINTANLHLNNYKIMLKSPLELINKSIQDIELLQGKILIFIKNKMSNLTSELSKSKDIILSDPQITQGYAFIYNGKKQIKSIKDLKSAKKLTIKFYDGEITVTV